MSLDVFVRKCGSWGLLPNSPAALAAYQNMKVMGQMKVGPGFSHMLSNRPDHLSVPCDVSSNDAIDLTAMPTGVPWWTLLEAEAH